MSLGGAETEESPQVVCGVWLSPLGHILWRHSLAILKSL